MPSSYRGKAPGDFPFEASKHAAAAELWDVFNRARDLVYREVERLTQLLRDEEKLGRVSVARKAVVNAVQKALKDYIAEGPEEDEDA